MPLDDPTRCLRRTRNKNESHLPKYSSLPELQLVVKNWPLHHCRQCGSTNPLISPRCLWCTWSCKEAKHEPASSVPRVRCVSAPPRVFIQISLSPSSGASTFLAGDHTNASIDPIRSMTPSKHREMDTKPFVIDAPPMVSTISLRTPVHQTLVDAIAVHDRFIDSHRNHIYGIGTNMSSDFTRQGEQYPSPAGFVGDVATATRLSSTPSPPTRIVTVEPVEYGSSSAKTNSLTHASRTFPLIYKRTSTVPLRLENVGHSRFEPPAAMKPSIDLKASRGALSVGYTEKTPTFHLDDTHEHAKNTSLTHDETTPSPIHSVHSLKHQHFRPLRRKNHLHIVPSNPDLDASEPIAISLNLDHLPPTPSHLGKKSSQILSNYTPSHSHTRAHSHPRSIVASLSSGNSDPVTPPMTPIHQRSLPSSAPPKMKSAGPPGSSGPELSPIRLGHPSRPYYNAIRKNGISPPPPPRTRPQSQPPPSSFHLGFDSIPPVGTPESTGASRHLSMSAMLVSPPAFSAFSVIGDNDNDGDDDNGDFEVCSEPTNSARLSLSSSIHRLSYNSHTQAHTKSLSRAKGMTSNQSSRLGFSMSGETELRMALSTSPSVVANSGRTTKDGFRFRETTILSETIIDNNDVGSTTGCRSVRPRDSFMGRVKKLRKGLKGMLTNVNTTTTTSPTTP